MATPFFTDKSAKPTEKTILAAVGKAAPAWREVFDRIHADHPDIEEVWNYYADGKSWLLKVTHKRKTVCWGAVEDGSFRLSFYFPARLTPELLESELSKERKDSLRKAATVGKLIPVSVAFGPKSGVEDVMTLIALKKAPK